MTKSKKMRRSFLKNIAAVAAIPAITKTASLEAASQKGPNTPKLLYDVDVLVVGGGPAGIGAALAAAASGTKTLIIENHAFFGGVASFCLGMGMNQMRPGGQPRSIFHELLIEKLEQHGSMAVQLRRHSIRCNVEYLKVAVLDALEQIGCRYLLHTQAVDTIVRNNRVVGVVAATKRGLATGHAAGLAAALSAKKGCTPRELNIKTLQDALTTDGVDLHRSARNS